MHGVEAARHFFREKRDTVADSKRPTARSPDRDRGADCAGIGVPTAHNVERGVLQRLPGRKRRLGAVYCVSSFAARREANV